MAGAQLLRGYQDGGVRNCVMHKRNTRNCDAHMNTPREGLNALLDGWVHIVMCIHESYMNEHTQNT